MTSVSYSQALEQGRIKYTKAGEEAQKVMSAEMPRVDLYGLRFPERDAKTDADFMRARREKWRPKWVRKRDFQGLAGKFQEVRQLAAAHPLEPIRLSTLDET